MSSGVGSYRPLSVRFTDGARTDDLGGSVAFAKRRVGEDGHVRFTGVYLDPTGRERSAGTFDSKRVALREARAAEAAIESGSWIDPTYGKITFRKYVEQHWWPSRHLELTTKASYRCYLTSTSCRSSARCRCARSCRRLCRHG